MYHQPSRWLNLTLSLLLILPGVARADVPEPGAKAAQFALLDQNGKTVKLADFQGKWLVLYFYPKADTPGCTQEACHFRDDLAKLTRLGAQVVGISVDDTAAQFAFAQKYHLPFTLLADNTAEVARAYGAITDFKVVKFAKRYTFLIDPTGIIRKTYLSVDTSRHSDEIIADLTKLVAG